MSFDAAVGAIYTLIGAVAGAALALVPLMLTAKEQRTSTVAGLCEILERERREIEALVSDIEQNAKTTPRGYKLVLRILTFSGWHAASLNADFLATLSENEWGRLVSAYNSGARLNEHLKIYLTFCTTQGTRLDYYTQVETFHQELAATAAEVRIAFTTLSDQLGSARKQASRRLRIDRYWVRGVAIVSIAFVIAAAFIASLVLHEAALRSK